MVNNNLYTIRLGIADASSDATSDRSPYVAALGWAELCADIAGIKFGVGIFLL